jgi:Ca2+-binding EF-hand superfamily protein
MTKNLQHTLKELFALYDFGQKGSINPQDCLTLLTSLGFTFDDYNHHSESLQGAYVDFPTFYTIAKQTMRKFDEKSLKIAFQHFDVQNTGKLSKDDFRLILEYNMDILHSEEVKMILDQVSDEIQYDNLIKTIIAASME